MIVVGFSFPLYKTLSAQIRIGDFMHNLPIGDVDSQTCNNLIAAKNADLVVTQSMANDEYESATTSEDKSGYAAAGGDMLDSKYLYSHKLCLAEISTTTYTSSQGKTDFFQILDLGSNNAFAENDIMVNEGKDEYFLYGQEQSKPISLSDIWSKIQTTP